MKVCLINTLYYPTIVGGAERSVQFLAEALVDKGHEVVVISLAPTHGIAEAEHNGVKVYAVGHRWIPWPFQPGGIPWLLKPYAFFLDSFYNPFVCNAVVKILTREQPDVVHSNNIYGFSSQVWRVVKVLGSPLVHTLRDHSLLCTRSTMWRKEHNCKQQCLQCCIHSLFRKKKSRVVDAVVGISDYILSQHQRYGLFNGVAVRKTVHNPCFSNQAVSFLYPSLDVNKQFSFGYLGRVEKEKGIISLLDSFSKVVHQYRCELLIGGEGDTLFKETIQRKYNFFSIKFLGFVVPEKLFNMIDMLIVPSLLNESLGRVVLEAYSCGIPVIGSNRGGIPEIVVEGETGFLFDPDIPDSLTELLRFACSNPHRIHAMKPACLEMAKRFAPEVIANHYLGVYEQVLSQYHAVS